MLGRRSLTGWILITPMVLAFWLSLAPTAHAQLNENCTISILNRTANVQPDGSWRIDNVPAGAQVRARVTCVENGVTQTGQSSFFTIESDIINGFEADIPIGVADPIPGSLTVTASTLTLDSIGASTQLAVTANFPDGSATDVTAASSGTNYAISNAAIATITPGGLVAAVSSGAVVVSALNEGALGLLRLQVVLSGDADGDGIPDDVELALGLDPNNPVDGLKDLDADGLTNAEEIALGTNPNIADSDGDTIGDGEEVAAGADGFVTNPLLVDTDGDGVRDALEIATGSDPADAASLNLSQALTSLEVTPGAFVLSVNTVIGEISRQLAVTGNLSDGTTIDLNSTTKGTRYSSSDLNVCNFGASDGEIFAGSDGRCSVTITNSGFSTAAGIVVRSFTPTPLALVDLPSLGNNVDVSGDFAYVAAGATGLHVVDVSDRSAPVIVGSVDTPGNANDVKIVGNTAYVADGASGLQIIDITTPATPAVLGAVDTPGDAMDVVVKGTLAYVADDTGGLQVIDVSDPSAPVIIGSVSAASGALGVDVGNTVAVLADRNHGLQVIDITDPTAPAILGSVETGNARDVVLSSDDTFAFVADRTNSFTSVDISNGALPVIRGRTPDSSGGRLVDVAVAGQLAFGADIFFVNQVPIIDVSIPGSPAPRAFVEFQAFRDDNGTGIAVDGSYLYLTANSATSGRLYIGQYQAIEDNDGIPPTVSITSPVGGDTVIEGTTLPIRVDATDDIGISVVEFVVDGTIVSSDTTLPYQIGFIVPPGISEATIGATAIDVGNNAAVAGEVKVNVIADPETTIAGRIVDQQDTPVGGVTVTCLEQSSVTSLDGSFSITGLPTVQGGIDCTVSTTAPNGEIVGLRVIEAVQPVPGGIADVGSLAVSPPRGEGPSYPAQRFSLGGVDPVSVAVADLNGDGRPDITTANDSGLVNVLLSNGDGTFQPRQTFGAGDFPESVAVADLNGDGRSDIVTANGGSDDVSVLLGNGDGTFQTGQTFAVGALPRSVAVADLNDDARPDIVTANDGGSNDVSVLLANDTGTFQTQQTFAVGDRPRSVALADVNGDGRPDILTANSGSNDVSVLLATGNGSFQTGQTTLAVGVAPDSIVVADLNGDSLPDIVTANIAFPDNVSVLLGNGDGTFQTEQSFAVGDFPRSVAVADLNGDARPDIVTANISSDDVSVLLGNGDGTFQAQQTFDVGSGPRSLALADLNSDGVRDLVTVSTINDDVLVLLGNGDGTFQTRETIDAGRPPQSLAIADLNADGRPDIVAVDEDNFSPRNMSVLLGKGDATFQAVQTVDVGFLPRSVVVADLNGDEQLDVVAVLFNSDSASVLLGNGDGTFQAQQTFTVGDKPFSVAVADLNGDARPDIVTANINSLDVSVLLGNGNGTFQPQQTFSVDDEVTFNFLNFISVAAADLNGDGRPDIVAAKSYSRTFDRDNISVLLGNGDGTFQAQQTFDLSVGSDPVSVAVVDLNDDARPDVVTANADIGSDITVFLGNGDGTFLAQQTTVDGKGAWSLAVADLNGDGRPDLVTAINTGVSVLFGDGNGAFQSQQRYSAGNARSVAVADLNGDEKPDVVAGDVNSGTVSILLHR